MCLGWNLSLDVIFVYKNFKLKNTSVNEILGVIINRELKFDKHVKYIYSKQVTNRMPWQEWPLSLSLFKITLFSNLSLTVNSITAHFYGCFVYVCQTIWLIKFMKRL